MLIGPNRNTAYPVFLPDPIAPHAPLNQGCVAWWLVVPGLDGGKYLYDLMGLNHGTLTNMGSGSGWQPPTRPGGFGQLNFDGSNDRVAVADSSRLNFGGDFTVAGWFASTLGNRYIVSKQKTTANYTGYGLSLNGSGSLFAEVSDGTYSSLNGTTTTLYGSQMRHAAFTRKGTVGTLYLNGRQDATGTVSGGDTTFAVSLAIGAFPDSTTVNAGPIDDVRLWNRAFSADELLAYYDESRRGYPTTLNRIAPTVFLFPPPSYTGAASLASVSTLVATGSLAYSGASSLASVTTLAGLGGVAYAGAASLAAVATLSASGSVSNAGVTGLASVCTLTASGTVAYAGAVALASVSTLAGGGAYSGPAGAALTSACTLVGAGHYSAGAGGSRCVLRGSGHVASVGSVAMVGVCTLRGSGQGQPPLIFEEALAQRLLANSVIAAVAGGRVVPGMIPQKTPLPCVTYAVPSKPRVPDLSGPAGIARARVNISCWAHKYGDAKTLARGVVAGIPIGFTGLLGTGVTITDTYHLNEMDTYEEPDNASDVGTYRVMFEMRMDYREAF